MEKASHDIELSRENVALFYFFFFFFNLFKSDLIIFPPHHVCLKEAKSSRVQ